MKLYVYVNYEFADIDMLFMLKNSFYKSCPCYSWQFFELKKDSKIFWSPKE